MSDFGEISTSDEQPGTGSGGAVKSETPTIAYAERNDQRLFTAVGVRQLDHVAIHEYKIPGIILMRRAGAVTLSELRKRWPQAKAVSVVCGAGNNAGDGYILAGLAAQKGLYAEVKWVVSPDRLTGDALLASQWASKQGVTVENFSHSAEFKGEVIVDALLGTGLQGEVRPSMVEPIMAINNSSRPVVAIDIPSGLNADTGAIMGICVDADLTVTFIGLKQGLYTGDAINHIGGLKFHDLDVPEDVYSSVEDYIEMLDIDQLLSKLVPRPRNSHKGNFGHLLLVGGDHGMPGSITMAAIAAARSGAGLTSVATRPEHITPLVTMQPEIMVNGVNSGQEFEPLLENNKLYAAIVIGPGLGTSAWSEQMHYAVMNTEANLVVDADGLNLIGQGKVQRDNWILTPHPGEAARLLNCSVAEVQQDRFKAVRQLQEIYGGVVLLKGAGSLICDGQSMFLCSYGNPGMSSAGMGDVLAGIIGAMICQGLSLSQSARLGACLHAKAADLVAERDGESGLMATDLIADVRRLVNQRDSVGFAPDPLA